MSNTNENILKAMALDAEQLKELTGATPEVIVKVDVINGMTKVKAHVEWSFLNGVSLHPVDREERRTYRRVEADEDGDA